ncbi:MAG: hypothetical protein LUH23_01100 [Oscillospiraceae bacterium]|nr:hypothetical protein [Oscillospiraceae bacterium]
MKKYICIFTAFMLILTMAVVSFAEEIVREEEMIISSDDDMIEMAEIEVVDTDEFDYIFLFGTTDVNFLNEYTLQYRIYTYDTEYTSLSDLYEADGDYLVPVVDDSGSFLGYVEGNMNEDGSWEIESVYQGITHELLYELIVSENICDGYLNAFIGGAPFNNNLGIILSAENYDVYFDVVSYIQDMETSSLRMDSMQLSDYFVNADIAANNIAEMFENVAEDSSDSTDTSSKTTSVVKATNSRDYNPATGAFLALTILSIALGTTVFSKKHN